MAASASSRRRSSTTPPGRCGCRGARTLATRRPATRRPPRRMAEGATAPVDLGALLAPTEIGSLRLPHRVVMGAMHMGTEADADAGEQLAAFYRERALGGAGLIVTGGWAVS